MANKPKNVRLAAAQVRLREEAMLWVAASRVPSEDPRDSVFKKVDNALFRAALRYAEIKNEE